MIKHHKHKPSDLSEQLRRAKASHRRVLKAFLALRAVKSVGHDLEPVLLNTQRQLLQMKDRLAAYNPDSTDIARGLVDAEAKRIVREMNAQIARLKDEPRTPVNARYIEADRELRPGDLEVSE